MSPTLTYRQVFAALRRAEDELESFDNPSRALLRRTQHPFRSDADGRDDLEHEVRRLRDLLGKVGR